MRKKSTVTYELDPERPKRLTAAQRAEIKVLAALPDELVDTTDIPPLTEKFWRNAVRNPFYRPVKRQLTVRIDADILAWLRSAGRGYQTKLNAILREEMMRDISKRSEELDRRPVRSRTKGSRKISEKGEQLGLGSRIAARFAGAGFNEEIPEQRGDPARPADFGPDED